MKKSILAFVAFILVVFPANSQMARLYTTETGLPNSRVNDIYQDSRGFVWITTENGLARFDGMDFTTFRFSRDRAETVASDLVLAVFEDSRGTLWVGTSTGLQIFNPEDNSFHRVDLRDPDSPGSTQYVTSIVEVKSGTARPELWIATSSHGVYILDVDTHAPKDERRTLLGQNLPSPFVNRVFQDSAGRVWLTGETGGLSVVDAATMRRLDISFDEDRFIRCFSEDPQSGTILIGTMEGLYFFHPDEGVIRSSSDPAARTCSVVALLPERMIGRAGRRAYLVGTETEGLRIYMFEEDRLREPGLARVPYDLSHWKVHALMEDDQGNVWIGAFQTGVLVLPRSMYGFDYLSVGRAGLYGRPAAAATSIVRDPASGALWVGTDGGGLLQVDRDGLRRTFFSAANSGLTNDSVTGLVFDREGTLWVATYLDGLFTYTPSGGFRPFADQDAMGTRNIACLAYDAGRDILYAGTYGAGLSVISPSQRKVQEVVSEDVNKWVSALMVDRDGTLWIGTFNGPLCYNHDVGRLLSYNVGDVAIQARVYGFYEADDGLVWIGTGEGLTACDRVRGTTRFYGEADGLPNNVVTAIREGSDGTLWISTSFGLSRLDPSTGRFTNYYAYDGLQGNEFHYGAAFADADGQLFFGGTGGVTMFYPQVVNQRPHDIPPLFFTRLTVLSEEVDYDAGREDNVLDKHITEATRITLPYKRNTFSLEFAALEYTNPRKIRFSYRLDRFDADWNYTTPDARVATYTNLPAGRYTLTVKAFFDGNESDFSSKSIDIRVSSPWYMTFWAFLGYGLLLAGIILFLWDNARRRRRQELEREASEIKDLKLQMFTNISHEIRTPLTLLMSPLKQMREAEGDPRKKGLYNLMYRNSLRILRLVNQLMDMRKVDEGKMKLHFLETDVVYFIRDIMQSFDELAVSRNIALTLSSASDVENLWIDQGNFDKIVFNLLSNAFKHTPDGGDITIDVGPKEKNAGKLPEGIAELVRIDITNSGSHLDEGDLGKVFERFFQSDVLDAKVGSGVGLSLTKMLVELHHGTIEAGNTPGGVRFSVFIPAGCAHLSDAEMSTTSHHKDLYTKYPTSEDLVRSTEDLAFTPAAPASGQEVKSHMRIVVVDDDAEIRGYLLSELGDRYNVKAFADAASAWADISVRVPDVVVTDLKMEGMDGIELCGKIKHNPETNHIAVILLTSSADEATQQRSVDSGADRFLSKPLSIDLLKGTIANILAARETLRTRYTGRVAYDYSDVKVAVPGVLQERVAEIIKRNLDNPDFGVDDLAREVGMSRVHLNRKLKEAAGISPSALIKSTRMKQAAYLLVHDKVNISEVAYRVGFSTPSYFSSSFREYFGMTPKEFVAKYVHSEDPDALEKLFEG